MNEQTNTSNTALHEALRLQEEACAGDVPGFASIAARIQTSPSPLDTGRWSAGKGAKLAAALASAQLRVIPHAVLPAALVVATAAVGAACLMGSAGVAANEAGWWFSAFLLVGIALTITLALSSERADTLALATPIGPQTVVLTRLTVVLGVDALAGLVASTFFAAWGSLELGAVVGAWLVPFALVAGASAFVAVWMEAAWMGALAGAVLVPFVLPAAQAASTEGAGVLLGSLQGVFGPAGVVTLGAFLLVAAVCSSRRAALSRLEAA